MTLNMRFSQGFGDFRVSGFGLNLEVAQVEGQVEVAISKGADGFTNVELIDVTDVSNDAVADSIIEESSLNDDAAIVDDAIDDGMDSSIIEESIPNIADTDVSDDSKVVTNSFISEDAQAELFTRLSALRKRLAIEQGKPPYIIFHDSTLRDIAREFPMDLKSLSKINGVGRVKLKRYGGLLLEAIHEYKGVTMAG
jgi:superfamily II DNA helicase RecQ